MNTVGRDRRARRVTARVFLATIQYVGALRLLGEVWGSEIGFGYEGDEWRSADCPAVNPYRVWSSAV